MTGIYIDVRHNLDDTVRWLDDTSKQVRFATAVALNRTAFWAETAVRKEMRRQFHQPTPYFLRSLRVIRANVNKPPVEAVLWFKDRGLDDNAESMVVPHIDGGQRKTKRFERRLQRIGVLPSGWYAVPGGGADFDANGNMSRGQLSTLLNVLGAYTEAGYNKANRATVVRLARGNAKRGVYGYTYWVNPVGRSARHHLPPGVYKRVETAFGSSLKPVLIFVSAATYRPRLAFKRIVEEVVEQRFPGEFRTAYDQALRTVRKPVPPT